MNTISADKQIYAQRLAAVFNNNAVLMKKYEPLINQVVTDLKNQNPGLDDDSIMSQAFNEPALVPVVEAINDYQRAIEDIRIDFEDEFGQQSENEFIHLMYLVSKLTP